MYLRANVWNVQMTRTANNSNILYPIFMGSFPNQSPAAYEISLTQFHQPISEANTFATQKLHNKALNTRVGRRYG